MMSDTTRKSDADTVVRLAAELAEANAELERIALAVGQWPDDDLAVKVGKMREELAEGARMHKRLAMAGFDEDVSFVEAVGLLLAEMKLLAEAKENGRREAWVKICGDGGEFYDAHGEDETAAHIFAEQRRQLRERCDVGFAEGRREALEECARMHKRLASAGFDDDVPFLQAVGLLLDEHRLLRAEIQRLNALPKALARPAEPLNGVVPVSEPEWEYYCPCTFGPSYQAYRICGDRAERLYAGEWARADMSIESIHRYCQRVSEHEAVKGGAK